MKWIALIKKLVASIIGANASSNMVSNSNFNISNSSYILALNPLSAGFNNVGRIIILMLVAILVLIGYTLFSNKNK